MADKKENTGSGTTKLDDLVGSSDAAGSGGTQKFNLDDIDLDDELEIGDESEDQENEEENFEELEFGESSGEIAAPAAEPKKDKGSLDLGDDSDELEMDSGSAAAEEPSSGGASGSMELDMSADDDFELDTGSTTSSDDSLSEDSGSMDLDMSEDGDEEYEAAPEDEGDRELTGDQIYEQSQSSIKTGGAATNSDISLNDDMDLDDDGPEPVSAKAPAPKPQKLSGKAPEKNAKPRKATKDHNPSCNFCKIALRRFKLMTIYEDDQVIAIMDPKPLMKGQVLICSKTHKSSLSDFSADENAHFFHVAKIISDAIKKSKIPAEAVSYFMSESVNEKDDLKHVYMSLIPRKKKDGIGLKFSKKNSVSSDDLELIGDHLIQFIA